MAAVFARPTPRMRKQALALALATVLSLLAASPASAATATFGANLARVPNNPTSCTEANLFQQIINCSVLSINPVTGESLFPPAGEGTVSAVRVRVGPVTGPMQVVVEQALRQDNPFEPGKPNYACCQAMALSQVFTPAPNAITTIPVNFRVRQDISPDANGYYVDQHLSLSVLNPNVPIPAAIDPNAGMTIWFPAWQAVGESRAGPAGGSGAMVLMNADWDPVGTPVAPVAPGVTPTVPRPLRIPNSTAFVLNGRARVPLVCRATNACVGRLLLQNRQATAAASALLARKPKRAAKPVTYGSVKFRIAPGKRKVVKVKLNRRGKRLLGNKSKPNAWASVKIAGYTIPPRKLTLKSSPKKSKPKKTSR